MTAPTRPTPLDLAHDWASRVHEIADYWAAKDRDEPGMGRIQAEIAGAGRQQFEAAQMASYMALVSIAEDMHRIVAIMTGEAAALLDEKWTAEAETRSGAVDDARATREHMRDWGQGADTHRGEEP